MKYNPKFLEFQCKKIYLETNWLTTLTPPIWKVVIFSRLKNFYLFLYVLSNPPTDRRKREGNANTIVK